MNATVTYVGPLSEGYVQCPKTCRNYAFKNGKPFELPENIAVSIAAQSPSDWSVDPVVRKLADGKALEPITPIVAAISESANSDETPDEKV